MLHNTAETDDLGHRSLQCGRVNDTLKCWLAWKERGDEGWESLVDTYIEIADYCEMRVNEHPKLEMMSRRKFANICMRYNPGTSQDLNALNVEIRRQLQSSGKFMISRSNIYDDVVLRPVTSGPDITKEIMDELLNEIVAIGDSLTTTK